jgi:glycosyltransferase involved in cell wall biosynthesis
MIVGLDARYAFRKHRRGIGNYVYNLLLQFEKLAPDVQWLLYLDLAADLQVLEFFRTKGFHIRQLPVTNPVLWEQVFLPRAATSDGPDILHCTANIAPLAYRGRLVMTVHDVIEFHRKEFQTEPLTLRHHLSRLYRMNAMKLAAQRADLVLTISEHARTDIADVLGLDASRIQVTRLGPSPQMQSNISMETVNTVRSRLGVPPRYVMTLGAVDPRKNTQLAVHAFLRWAESAGSPDVHLVVIGVEDPRVLGANVTGRVHVHGYLSDNDLAALYHGATAFLYLSRYEGFGLPVLDAMSCGVPVICSKTTSVGEVAGDSALLVDETNPAEIVHALDQIVSSSQVARTLRQRGLERVRLFQWHLTASLTLKGYSSVMPSHPFTT